LTLACIYLYLGSEEKMEYKFTLELTKDYFSESYNQSIRYGNKWRKFEYLISILFLVIGVSLFIYTNMETLLPAVFIAIAIFEYISPYIKKIFWLKRQTSNKIFGTSVEITITDKALESKGQFSEGSIKWSGFERSLETPLGLMLWPQKGIKIYFPKSVVSQKAINYVLLKCA